MNEHRSTALQTMEAFREAAGDNREIEEQVIAAVVTAVFAAQPTGYAAFGKETTDLRPPVLWPPVGGKSQ